MEASNQGGASPAGGRPPYALPSLREFFGAGRPTDDLVANACGWAIEQITAQRLAAPVPTRRFYRDWFLMPTN